MNKKPMITTIIPTYKRPKLLSRAIKSVLNQSFKDIQICVYDNASEDETEKVVKEFAKKDPRVKYHCHEKTIRSIDNFQFGLDRVDTPYFSFLSDDDLLMPNFYEEAIKAMEVHDVAFFAGNLFSFNKDLKVKDIILRPNVQEGVYHPEKTIETFVGIRFFVWTSVLFNTEKAKSIGKIDDTMIISDGDYLLKLMYRYPIYVSRKIVAAFFINPQGLSNKLRIGFVWPAIGTIIDALNKIPGISQSIKDSAHDRLLNYVEDYLYECALKEIENCNYDVVWQIVSILKNEIHKDGRLLDIYINMAKKMTLKRDTRRVSIKLILQKHFKNPFQRQLMLKNIDLHRFYAYNCAVKFLSKLWHKCSKFKFYIQHRDVYFKYFKEKKKANKMFSNFFKNISCDR